MRQRRDTPDVRDVIVNRKVDKVLRKLQQVSEVVEAVRYLPEGFLLQGLISDVT